MSERPYGVPLTDEERAVRHQALYGEKTLPKRGTGYTRHYGSSSSNILLWVGLGAAAVAGVLILWQLTKH